MARKTINSLMKLQKYTVSSKQELHYCFKGKKVPKLFCCSFSPFSQIPIVLLKEMRAKEKKNWKAAAQNIIDPQIYHVWQISSNSSSTLPSQPKPSIFRKDKTQYL